MYENRINVYVELSMTFGECSFKHKKQKFNSNFLFNLTNVYIK